MDIRGGIVSTWGHSQNKNKNQKFGGYEEGKEKEQEENGDGRGGGGRGGGGGGVMGDSRERATKRRRVPPGFAGTSFE